ncbi:MAG: transposase [Candidatus Chryseobacterium colombiense]|nr:transposase [Chryseobacterium sp.]WEK71171.1 MAG: transposase [Chryseobacterium sp.]
MNIKEIHIGQAIKLLIQEQKISKNRIINFFQCTDQAIELMYRSASLDTDLLLKWSKLLEYDFFRLYSQHLILYSPPAGVEKTEKQKNNKKTLPHFRKNIYTREIIDFIVEQIATGEMTKIQVLERYRIPKTTLYKWISKYGN